ncbi:hypothetical protein [Klenkia brasiliensis]|uniref:Uncharacterized protein n=1 Tax=Klenkia brasiliensis TaxID=333142 RepID=A0A1G7YID0_9ACTN|nr:hypothetical protein [Klenkia brasiliensis]SDG96134.1 hypothetical protein SAMN05660324_3969 [Klenkia brasiliensis]
MIALVLLVIVGVVAAWLAVGLLVAVPLCRRLRRNRGAADRPLRRTERGTHVGLLALGVLLAVVVAVATRGQVVTWDGVLTVGVPA